MGANFCAGVGSLFFCSACATPKLLPSTIAIDKSVFTISAIPLFENTRGDGHAEAARHVCQNKGVQQQQCTKSMCFKAQPYLSRGVSGGCRPGDLPIEQPMKLIS